MYLPVEKHRHLADTEQLLLKGCIRGDRASQSKFYNHFAPTMFGVCMRYAKSREDAEEILHEGFLRVFKYLHQFKGTGSLEGWIRRIMVNCCILKYREKLKMVPVYEITETTGELSTDATVFSDMEIKDLMKMVQSLPAGYRMIFNLYVFEGYKHREIAEMLGISEGTSKSNLFDARAILQKELMNKKKMINNR